ncbi:MAG: hypothetical protein Q9160_007570 [Pyrenula sp. 1 TL-2023]
MADFRLSSQGHLAFPQPSSQPPNSTIPAGGINKTADQEGSKLAVQNDVHGAVQSLPTGSAVAQANNCAAKVFEQVNRGTRFQSLTSHPEQALRQRLNKPLPALPPDRPLDRTSKDVRIHLEALIARSDHITGTEASDLSGVSLQAQSNHHYLTEKVNVPELYPHLEEVKMSDVDVSFYLKRQKRASISTLGTTSSTGRRQTNDRHSSSSLLDCHSSSRKSGSVVSILRAKASLISIGPKRASRRIETTDEERPQENDPQMTFPSTREKLEETEDVYKSDCLVTAGDRVEFAVQSSRELSSPKETNDADFRQLAKRLDNVFENRKRARRPLRGSRSYHHLPSFSQAPEDSDTDIDDTMPNHKLQSLREALQEGPPGVEQRSANVKQTLLLHIPHTIRSKPRNQPTLSRLASLKNITFPQLFHQHGSVFGQQEKVSSLRAHTEVRSHDDKKPLSTSFAPVSSVHYEITSSFSPLASVKPTDISQNVPVSVSEAQYQAKQAFLNPVKDVYSEISTLKEKMDLPRTRQRAATLPSLHYHHNMAEGVADNLRPKEESVLLARDGKRKPSTWAPGDQFRPIRPTVLPQPVPNDAHEVQPDINEDLQMPKTPEKPTPLSDSSCSDSTPSLQACDSTISLNDEPTPVTVIRVDPFEPNPNSPGVIRIYPFPSPPKPSQFDSEYASEAPILSHEALASHIAKLDLGPPPPIPPRHPARTAKTSDSPSAKPKRGHSRRISVNKNGELLDVPTIRADVAHLALTRPIPSPKYIEIAPSPPPPSLRSSIVQSQPLENPFILRRSISSHSIRGHPPINFSGKCNGRTNQAPRRDSSAHRSEIVYTPRSSSDSDSRPPSRHDVRDFRTKYTTAIDSIMLELDEMRSKYIHPKPKLESKSHPLSSSASQTSMLKHNKEEIPNPEAEGDSLMREYYEKSLEAHLRSGPDYQHAWEPMCFERGGPRIPNSLHHEGCRYWKATETEFGEIRTPPPHTPPSPPSSLLTPRSSKSSEEIVSGERANPESDAYSLPERTRCSVSEEKANH